MPLPYTFHPKTKSQYELCRTKFPMSCHCISTYPTTAHDHLTCTICYMIILLEVLPPNKTSNSLSAQKLKARNLYLLNMPCVHAYMCVCVCVYIYAYTYITYILLPLLVTRVAITDCIFIMRLATKCRLFNMYLATLLKASVVLIFNTSTYVCMPMCSCSPECTSGC